jgi:hypothetical protein
VDAFRRRAPEGDVTMWLVAPNVVVQINRGEYVIALAREVVQFYDALWDVVSDLQIFDDFSELTGYTREVREFLTVYARPHREIGAYHFLTRSQLVTLGMSAYGIQTGRPVYRYADRLAFADALARATERR